MLCCWGRRRRFGCKNMAEFGAKATVVSVNVWGVWVYVLGMNDKQVVEADERE